jgi:hypothetical protein
VFDFVSAIRVGLKQVSQMPSHMNFIRYKIVNSLMKQ